METGGSILSLMNCQTFVAEAGGPTIIEYANTPVGTRWL